MRTTRSLGGFKWGFAAALALILAGAASTSALSPTKAEVTIGWQPTAGMSAVISQYMITNKVFEEHARKAGYDLTINWGEYPSAQPMIDAMIAKRLDMGLFGATPVIRSISRNLGILPLSIGLGHENQYFAIKPGGTVRKPEDLKGKRIGLILGGEQQIFLINVLIAQFGEADPAKLDIQLVSLQNQGQTCSVPAGTDVTLCINSVGLPKIVAGEITWAFDMFGNTGPAYEGPAGTGTGHKIPAVAKSPFNPEGFFLARAWWVARADWIKENPRLVQAFVEAEQAALAKVKKMTPGDASQIMAKVWKLKPEIGGPMLQNDLLWIRGWVWPTESDYWGMVRNSKFLAQAKLIDSALTWDQVLTAVKDISPLLEKAYKASGSYPSEAEFTKQKLDLRGLPVWKSSRWTKRP